MTMNNPFNPDPKSMEDMKNKSMEIQNKMAETQKNLANITVEGKAGIENYGVKVYLNGRYEATKVTIDPELLKQPAQILSDLIASAITDAAHNAEIAIQNEMLKVFQNFKVPGLK